MAEGGAEHTGVKAASVASADDGLGIELVSNAKARRKLLGFVDAPAESGRDTANSGDVQIAVGDVQQGSVGDTICSLREVEIPAQAQVKSEAVRDAPGVLPVEEGT